MKDEDAHLIRRAEEAVPPLCEKATIGVFRTFETATIPLATGTLFKVADSHFAVTAGHAISDAKELDSALVITGDKGAGISVNGEWVLSPTIGDIAVHLLSEGEVADLEGKEFVGLRDVVLAPNFERGFFRLIGYPQMWSDASGGKVELGQLVFATTVHREPVNLADFDPKVHLLLNASKEGLRDLSGEETRFKDRYGVPVSPPVKGFRGVSGAGVWRIGNPDKPVTEWVADDARIVGVQTGVYPDSNAIKVTRWSFVLEHLYARYPQVRRAIQLVLGG